MISFLRRQWFPLVLVLLAFFNIFDAVSTDYVLSIGAGVELNPLMSWLYEVGPWAFHGFKAVTITFCIAMAWHQRHVRAVRVVAVVVTGLYELLFWYQIYFLFFLIP